MTPREKQTVATITRHLERLGGYVDKTHGDAAKAGRPDLVCCLHGRYIAVEVKAPGASRGATRRQLVELDRIRRAGGIAFVASSTDDVDRELARATARAAAGRGWRS